MPQLSFNTFLGAVSIAEDDGALVSVDWGFARDQDRTALLLIAREEVFAYLAGDLRAFGVPIRAAGTAYQRRVWDALRAIPYGATRTYAEVARAAGGGPRSVGGAVGRNPIPIIIPCHRVLAASGLGGYSGGDGVSTKRALLKLESIAPDAQARPHASETRSAA